MAMVIEKVIVAYLMHDSCIYFGILKRSWGNPIQ
jgi:hypothetical protein